MTIDIKKLQTNFDFIKNKFYNKKIILFGAGIVAEKTLNYFDKKKIDYILDNSKNLYKYSFNGLKVNNPSILKKKYKGQPIIICSTSFFEIINQLKKFKKKLNIFINPILNDRVIISEIDQINKDIIFTSGMQPQKNKLSGGGVYKISYNSKGNKIKKIHSGNSYGILKNNNKIIITDDNSGILIFSKKLKLLKKKKLPNNVRPHGIAFCKKVKNYFIVSSMRDCVLVFDEEFNHINQIDISNKFKKVGTAQHHCNDIAIIGSFGYVSMFSLSGNFKKDFFDGGLVEFDTETLKITNYINKDLWMPHSISFFRNSLTILDSLKGNLLSNNFQVLGSFPGFSRGLDYDGKFFYIGQSRNRNYSKILGISNNISIDSSIIIFEPETKVSKSILIPSTISEIHSIMVL